MIILLLGTSVNKHEEVFLDDKKSKFSLDKDIILFCPWCGSDVWMHGGYWRNCWEYMKKRKIWIIRVKCKNCIKTHAVIPDFLLPDKKYPAKEVEQVIEAKEEGKPLSSVDTTAEGSTMQRWWNQFKRRSIEVINMLEALLSREYNEMISLIHSEVKGLKRIKLLVNKFLEQYPGKKYTSNLGLANIWLNAEGSLIYL